MIRRGTIFLALNFAALGIGGLFTGEGVPSDWYQNLDKAPWTPPGWVFGFAWTSIMICFGAYMTVLWSSVESKKRIIIFYSIQLTLNISWNPVFFYYQNALVGLIIILGLTVLIWYLLLNHLQELRWKSLLVLPYGIWLIIASSLNAYILLKN
jgi:tryptophan-rich sensory protein